MALGLGDGGEQNAPLGRAVIGGLLFATLATLVFVPVVFSFVHARQGKKVPHRAQLELVMSLPERPPLLRSHHVAPVYSGAGGATAAAPSRRSLQLAAVIAGGAAVLIVAAGLVTRAEESAELRDWTDAQAIQTVAVAPPGDAGAATTLNLPGRIEAYTRAPLYARVGGYLKSWKYDIGAQVKAGALMAEIEARISISNWRRPRPTWRRPRRT